MPLRMDRWGVYVISHISGHISTRKCARRLISAIASLSTKRDGDRGVRILNSRGVRRQWYIGLFFRNERFHIVLSRRMGPDLRWLGPRNAVGPQSIIHLGQSRCNEGIKNRVTITSAVSARDTSDKYSRANKVYFYRERRSVSVTYAKIPASIAGLIKFSCRIITINDNTSNEIKRFAILCVMQNVRLVCNSASRL